METILPLVGDGHNRDDECMFDVYCSGHRASVLLGPDNILRAVNRRGGVDLHWRCTCGTTGIRHFLAPGRPE
jgi:hypothetical protein